MLREGFSYTRNGRRAQHGGIFVLRTTPIPVERPNRRAAGAQATLERAKLRMGMAAVKSDDTVKIAVRGTTDALAAGMTFRVTRKTCTCCGGKAHGKFVLNDAGRARLKALRRLRAERKED